MVHTVRALSCSVAICYSTTLILTHWSRVTRICISKIAIIGSNSDLSPERRQAIIWTNAGILLIGSLGTNFGEILIEIYTFSVTKMPLKMSGKWRPFCIGFNVVTHWGRGKMGDTLQTFSNAFSWIKIVVFWLKFHWLLFPRVQLAVFQHSDNGLVPVERQDIIWTNDGPVYWRIYASLGLNELNLTVTYWK